MVVRIILPVIGLLIVPVLATAPSEQDHPYSKSGTGTGASAPVDPSNVPESDAGPSDAVEEVPRFIPDKEALRKSKAEPDTNQADPGDDDAPDKGIDVGSQQRTHESPWTSSSAESETHTGASAPVDPSNVPQSDPTASPTSPN